MSFAVGGKFYVGINLGWFYDDYGSDLGTSEFSGSALWTQPDDVPLTGDLSKPAATNYQPYLLEHPEAIDAFFVKIQGLDIVRIWLFERLEGLHFSR